MILLYSTIISLCVIQSNTQNPEDPQQIHLSLGKDVTQIIVTWSTMNETDEPIVQYGIKETNLEARGTSKFFNSSKYHWQVINKVVLSDLLPLKNYTYRCGSNSSWSSQYNFKSLPIDNKFQPHIALYGDMGIQNQKILNFVTKDVQDELYDLILHIGDIAYNMNDNDGKVGDSFMNLIQPIAANVPYMTCPGNHEYADNFTEYKARFNMPGSPNNISYSFDIGPLHIISISTEAYYYLENGLKPLANQYFWLLQDLEEATKPENRKKRPWIVIVGHRPMYCSTTDGDDCTNPINTRTRVGVFSKFGIEKLFRKYRVDLAIWGHEHIYERLWPVHDLIVYNGSLKTPYTHPGATAHVITGAAGGPEYLDNFKSEVPAWSAVRKREYGYGRLKAFNSTHLTYSQVSTEQNREVIDYITIIKNSTRSTWNVMS